MTRIILLWCLPISLVSASNGFAIIIILSTNYWKIWKLKQHVLDFKAEQLLLKEPTVHQNAPPFYNAHIPNLLRGIHSMCDVYYPRVNISALALNSCHLCFSNWKISLPQGLISVASVYKARDIPQCPPPVLILPHSYSHSLGYATLNEKAITFVYYNTA